MYVCDGCQQPIVEEDFGTLHVHHNADACGWMPSDRAIKEGGEYGELLEHEMLCSIRVRYHQNCCRKCGAQLSGVT
jgi:hypothetical protein